MRRLNDTEAINFATEWIEAWNAHDLHRIMGHYADDVMLHSPVVSQLLNDPTATVKGKEALRNYFRKGLEAFPKLQFELQEILIGTESIVLFYKNQRGTHTAEYMELNENGKIKKVRAHYSLLAS